MKGQPLSVPPFVKPDFSMRMRFISTYGYILSMFEQSGRKEEIKKEDEKWHFCNRTLLRLTVFRVAFGHLYGSCWS